MLGRIFLFFLLAHSISSLAIGYRPYDDAKLADGIRSDRLQFFDELKGSSPNLEEEFLKKTILSKVLCQIESPFANAECIELSMFYLSQKKIPRLLDFKVSAMSTKWILKALVNIVRQISPTIDKEEQKRLQSAIMLIGIAMSQDQALSSASAIKILEALDPIKPWFQALVLSVDFKAYLPFVEEALNWIQLRPTESVVNFIAPYFEAVIAEGWGLCYTNDGKSGFCLPLSLSSVLSAATSNPRSVDSNANDLLFSGVLATNPNSSNGAFNKSSLAGVRVPEIKASTVLWQFSGSSDHYCTFDGKTPVCHGPGAERVPPIDPSKILQVFTSSEKAAPYYCLVYLESQTSAMTCWGQSPFPNLVKDVSYVLGSSDQGCVMGLTGLRCYQDGKEFFKKTGVTNAAVGEGELCTQSNNSEKWECDGKIQISAGQLFPGISIEKVASSSSSPVVSIDNHFIKFDEDFMVSAGTPKVPPLDTEFFKGLHLLLNDKKIKSVLTLPPSQSSFFLTEEGELYSFNGSGVGRMEPSSSFSKALTTEVSPGLIKEWPLKSENDQADLGVINFKNTHCEFTKDTPCPANPLFKPSVSLSEIEGILPNGCYFTKSEFVCDQKRWPIESSSINHAVELHFDNFKGKSDGLPTYCIPGQKQLCFNKRGESFIWPAKDSNFRSTTVTPRYYCISADDKLSCSDGSSQPWFRLFGKADQIHFGLDSVVVLEGTTLKQLLRPGGASEQLIELKNTVVQQLWFLGDSFGDLFCYRTKDLFSCFGNDSRRSDASRGFDPRDGIKINASTKIEVVEKDNSRELCVEISKTEKYCSGKYDSPVSASVQVLPLGVAQKQPSQWPHYFQWGAGNGTSAPARIRWANLKIESMLESSSKNPKGPCFRWSNGMTTCGGSNGAQVDIGPVALPPKEVTFGVIRIPNSKNQVDPISVACGPNENTSLICKSLSLDEYHYSVLNSEMAVPVKKSFAKIYITPTFICGQAEDELSCWGYSLSPNQQLLVPSAPKTLNLPGIRQVVYGDEHVCVLYRDGVKCFGPPQFADYGQADVPANLGSVEWLLAGRKHTCAKVKQGLRCWGFWRKIEEANAK